ncbi:MAG: DedA family protein [Alphaproteobacteria bacterium]|nr:DedA family protein [Alphaproteobacteria bacterium]
MVEHIISLLAIPIIITINYTGYVGIAFLMAIESACIPLPSEIIMTFAGAMVAEGHYNLWLVATAGAIGNNLGSHLAYEIGARGGRRAIERWGQYILLSERDLARADWFFGKFGSAAVFLARLLPVIRTFIALPAGIARMNIVKFHIYTFLGSWPWCFGLAYLGMKLGAAWQGDNMFKQFLHKFDVVIAVALILAVIWFVYSHWSHRQKRK